MAYRPPSAGTAETMLLIGLIFQIIIAAFFFFAVGVAGLIASTAVGVGAGFLIFPIISLIFFGLIPFFLVYVSYEWCYKRAKQGDYAGARTPTLVLTILGFIFGAIITGIFYLIGYIKLGDALNEQRQGAMYGGYMPGAAPGYAAPPGYGAPMPGYAPAPGYAPQPGAAPQPAAAPVAPQAPVCPRCQRPATWVPQYNRYYCYSCAQYL